MKSFAIVVLCVVLAVVVSAVPDKYTTKYDNIDIDSILNSGRLTENYCKCLLDKGPCTKEGTELKKHIADALQTDCSKCSETQKNGAEKVIRHLSEHKKECWEELKKKYDPEGKYINKYENEAKARGIKA